MSFNDFSFVFLCMNNYVVNFEFIDAVISQNEVSQKNVTEQCCKICYCDAGLQLLYLFFWFWFLFHLILFFQ